MRAVATLPIMLIAFLPGAAHAADCSADVSAAFGKQIKSAAFRLAMSQPTAEGPVKMTVDYIPPSKMLQTVTAPHMPGEQQTMLVGERAFAGSSGAWEELMPQFSQSIITEVATTLSAPVNIGHFECLGNVDYGGRKLVAYRSAADGADAPAAAKDAAYNRTVYVDPATGLPAFNIVAPTAKPDDAAIKIEYSYPTDVVIEAPQGAPAQKLR